MSFIDYIDGFDIAEGTAAGGLMGLVVYVVAGAVATLPSAFLTAASVPALTGIAGALTFATILVKNGRGKQNKSSAAQ